MLKYFSQPFPTYNTPKKQLGVCIISGVFVFAVLYLLKPFGMMALVKPLVLWFAIVFGLVTFVVLIFSTILIPYFIPTLFDETKWTVGKEIIFVLLTVLLISICNFLTNNFLQDIDLNLSIFFIFFAITLFIGFLPISCMVMLKQQILLNKYQHKTKQFNDILNEKVNSKAHKVTLTETHISEKTINLIGDYQAETLFVTPENLYFLSSADNYVRIIYSINGSISIILFRCTLKKMENTLAEFNDFMRCHRSYIVNISKIEKTVASGNGIKLKLKNIEELVPVGETFLKNIKYKLKTI